MVFLVKEKLNLMLKKNRAVSFYFIATAILLLQSPLGLAKQWSLVWSDEFDVSGEPNPDLWNYERGYVRNGEKQFYTVKEPKNARIENGLLVIEAHKSKVLSNSFWEKLFSDNYSYTSASLTTRDKVDWIHPRVEVRAKLPSGVGLWPAIWLSGADPFNKGWPTKGEVDIMEFVGFDSNRIHSAIHTKDKNHNLNNAVSQATYVEDLSTNFHVYSAEINEERIDFWIDNKLHFSYEKEHDKYSAWPFDESFYLILNLAIGGGWGGQKGIDDAIFPQKFLIDYVRVYQRINN
jgi:beta-glucanase (GH16 family)